MQGEHCTFKTILAQHYHFLTDMFSQYISSDFPAKKSNKTLEKPIIIYENENAFSKTFSPHCDTVYVIVDEFE